MAPISGSPLVSPTPIPLIRDPIASPICSKKDTTRSISASICAILSAFPPSETISAMSVINAMIADIITTNAPMASSPVNAAPPANPITAAAPVRTVILPSTSTRLSTTRMIIGENAIKVLNPGIVAIATSPAIIPSRMATNPRISSSPIRVPQPPRLPTNAAPPVNNVRAPSTSVSAPISLIISSTLLITVWNPGIVAIATSPAIMPSRISASAASTTPALNRSLPETLSLFMTLAATANSIATSPSAAIIPASSSRVKISV